ncbi:MAG: hypothetical protein WBL65_27880 [Bryobacteraceae bacterium]
MQPEKGPNLSGIDPATGHVTALFHPRDDEWSEHFSAHAGTLIPLGVEIRGLTPKGRATVRLLGLNEEMRQMLRYELWLEGLYPIGIRGRRELRRHMVRPHYLGVAMPFACRGYVASQ